MLTAISGIIGVIVGGFLGHFLHDFRDRNSRKRAFIGFLEAFKSDISATQRGPTNVDASVSKTVIIYDEKIGSFREQSVLVRGVFKDEAKLASLVENLATLSQKDWYKKQPQDAIIDGLERLLEFCR